MKNTSLFLCVESHIQGNKVDNNEVWSFIMAQKQLETKNNAKKHAEHDHDHSHDHSHNDHHDHCHGTDSTIAEDNFAPQQGDSLWHISGMDCASCTIKITNAIAKMPSVENVHVSLMRETLSLKFDESKISREKIENTITSLGYTAKRLVDKKQAFQQPDLAWWQTDKARYVFSSVGLVIIAYIVSFFKADWTSPVFIAASLAALYPVAKRAFAAQRTGSIFTIEMLITIAAIGAIFIDAAEEAAVVIVLFSIGELLEGIAAGRARAGIKALHELAPKTAMVETINGLVETAADDLTIGSVIVARTGDRIAADGVVLDGMSSVNEAPITGESMPKTKGQGNNVFAGSINLGDALKIKVLKNARDNTIARIIELVENAQEAKAPTERFIDNFARYYMPIIVAIAILTAIIPPLLFGGEWFTWIYKALALLLIGCPCALVISVPASIASSLAAATRRGLLIKGGQVLETLAKIKIIAFDKTGTLTNGTPLVSKVFALDDDGTINADEHKDIIAIASAMESISSHPLAQAIVAYGEKNNIKPVKLSNISTLQGKGLAATIKEQPLFLGAPRFAKDYANFTAQLDNEIIKLEQAGNTTIVLVKEKQVIGIIAMRDEPRSDAKTAMANFKQLHIEPIMLTGDNKRTATAISNELKMSAYSELLPEDKSTIIAKLKSKGLTAMVGDGINDAPALALANVGIAMGSGTDVALETADAAILRNRVGDVVTLVKLAKATMANIHQNVAIALGLKIVFLLATLFWFADLWLAIFADTGATLLVTLNALRLLVWKKD